MVLFCWLPIEALLVGNESNRWRMRSGSTWKLGSLARLFLGQARNESNQATRIGWMVPRRDGPCGNWIAAPE